MVLYMNNSGFVRAHRKGSGRDAYIWTLAKFMEDFCKGLGGEDKAVQHWMEDKHG